MSDGDRDERFRGVGPEFHRSPRYSRSLAVGLTMARCFEDHRALGIADMADMLGLTPSTAHRYAISLVAFGWLQQTQQRKYRLANGSVRPGMAVLGEIALDTGCDPVLLELRGLTGYTASLGVLDGDRVTYVRRLHGHRKGQFGADGELRAGAHVPVHCTALGKALLAGLPADELGELLANVELKRYGPRTITGKRRLREELEDVRSAGVALSDREHTPPACSVAAAVPVAFRGHRLAVEVNVPAGVVSPDRLFECLGPLVGDAARRVSELMREGAGSPALGTVAAGGGQSGKHSHI